MADVARVAGVSLQTVSRVVNGLPNIRNSTRARVETAISELGYRPNAAARTLATRRSGTIGILGTESDLFGPASLRRSVREAARDAGYFASSVTLRSGSDDDLRDALDNLSRQAVEGIVMVVASSDAPKVARAQHPGVPVVVVEGDMSASRLSAGVDQELGARLVARHLLRLGHTRMAHVAGPPDWTETKARQKGWQDTLAEAGVVPVRVEQGDWSAGSGYRAGLALADAGGITAVFVANDQMTVGVLLAFHERGVRVPDDVSVVGFDDIPESAFLIPPLTTVRQDFGAVGRLAIDVLHAALQGTPEGEFTLIQPVLVPRASSGPPPATD
jgi:DNA-binding LacI/PurR family transcriptional regulator